MNEPLRLPTPEEVFDIWFRPWYPDQGNDRTLYGLRADLEEIELPDGTSPKVLHSLDDPEDRQQILQHLEQMSDAARADWPTLFGVEGDPGPAWLEAFEQAVDEPTLRKWLETSPPNHLQNNLLVMACEAAMVVAACLQARRPALQWLPDIPYWDSTLFDLNSKVRLPVFHWVIRRLSSRLGKEPLQQRIDAAISFMEETR